MATGALAKSGEGRRGTWYQWAVPFSCGSNPADLNGAVRGTYAVAIEILNAGPHEVMLSKHVALSSPAATPAPAAEPIRDALPAGQAFQVDCEEIVDSLFALELSVPVPSFLQGWLVVRAHAPLDVALTQTASGETGEVSVDVESIEPRPIRHRHIHYGDHGGDRDRKVEVCHVPPGNPSKAHTIRVGESAVGAHLGHGDSVGSCD